MTFIDKYNVEILCQIDKGASCYVMAFNDLCDIQQTAEPDLKDSSARLKMNDGTMVKVKGECDLNSHKR